VRSDVSSRHHRPPNYLIGGRHDDPLLLKEWALVLRGDGKSPRTIEGYSDSVRQLAAFLERGGFPPLTEATAEHVRVGRGSQGTRGKLNDGVATTFDPQWHKPQQPEQSGSQPERPISTNHRFRPETDPLPHQFRSRLE